MKRFWLITFLLVLSLALPAQNNPYGIDDECYVIYRKVESALGTAGFSSINNQFLSKAIQKKDTKAQTLYYVQQLKHTSHLAQNIRKQNIRDRVEWDAQSWNSLVDEQRKTLMDVVKATGYMQYYYYASDLCQTYYFNTDQDVVAVEILMSMMKEARLSGDERTAVHSTTP